MTSKRKPEGVGKGDAEKLRGGCSKQREKHRLLVIDDPLSSCFKVCILLQIHSNDKWSMLLTYLYFNNQLTILWTRNRTKFRNRQSVLGVDSFRALLLKEHAVNEFTSM